MSDFPRGWTQSVDNGGSAVTAASIILPAAPGVIHILDDIEAQQIWEGGASALHDNQILVSSSDGTFNNTPMGRLITTNVGDKDALTHNGLEMAAGVGASLTVNFSGAIQFLFEMLTVHGHDI